MHLSLICLMNWFLLANFVASQVTSATFSNTTTFPIAKPGCPSNCGNVTIPYPFGVLGSGANCSLNPWFDVGCDAEDVPYMMVTTRNEHRLVNISESNIRIRIPDFSSRCDDQVTVNITLDYSDTPYSFSEANKLTLIGCSDLAVLEVNSRQYSTPNLTESNFATGCVSFCSEGDWTRNGSCPGNGCCQISVPKGTISLNSTIVRMQQQLGRGIVDLCSFSFVGEVDTFAFAAVRNVYTVWNWMQSAPMVLDWRISDESCQEAERNLTSFACQDKSICVDAEAGVQGYRCKCLEGYEGNPYLHPGCRDINECDINPCPSDAMCINTPGSYECGCISGYQFYDDRNITGCRDINECDINPCPSNAMCINTPGSYECRCISGYQLDGDGNITGESICIQIPQPKLSKLAIGLISGMSLIALLSFSYGSAQFVKKKKNQKRRQKFFKQNGGLLLQKETSANEGIMRKTRIFSAKELEKATDKFIESRILGQGGQGTVYKGMLSNGQIVAVKKSKLVNEDKSKDLVEQFINEVVIMSQISHRNVVKLLGCCLETKIPHLVYEFMPNGTLLNLIQDTEFPFSWKMRLIIAADVAGALAYLHSATSVPIFHRDIKSSNILVDEKFIAKVSDFGTSKSVQVDQTHLTTLVNGTFGYIDPEYFRSSQFTEKSDVYSFGVVLVELLTGLRAIIPSTNEGDDKSLVSRFTSTMENNNLELILASQVSGDGERNEVLRVAELATRCLNFNGKNRPTMKEVAMELENVRKSQMGAADATEIPEDSASFNQVFWIENSNYSWTDTSDFFTASSSDVFPIMHDTT